MTRSRAERRLAYDAAFLALAVILSYLEALLSGFFPIPGLKLGLPNVAVMAVFRLIGRRDALAVSFLRCMIHFLLFGSATALVLSLAGAALSFLVLLLFDGGRSRRIGEIGVSVLSAFAHITGQCLAASLFYGFFAVFSFYPILTALSVPSGIFTGLLLLLILRSTEKISQKGKGTP